MVNPTAVVASTFWDYLSDLDPQHFSVRKHEYSSFIAAAADLIGQMGGPLYHRKINGLFHEFAETGMARQLGYESPMDLVDKYPDFFWSQVQPYIGPALRYLEQTIDGEQWVAHLYNHVFQVQHRASYLGPFRGARWRRVDEIVAVPVYDNETPRSGSGVAVAPVPADGCG